MEGEEGGVTGLARVQRLEDYRRKARFKQVHRYTGIQVYRRKARFKQVHIILWGYL